MKKKYLFSVSLTAVFFSMSALAMEFNAPIVSKVLVTKKATATKSLTPPTKSVYLMNIKLSSEQKQKILNYKPTTNSITLLQSTSSLPPKIDNGMNGVPVLDQGSHGTCVTFATTGAIDALLGKGDYISELCSLELGSYLEERSYYPSGWNGSTARFILNQMQEFGIISKHKQLTESCAGQKKYPTNNGFNTGNPMSLDEYKSLSESLRMTLYWEPILTYEQRIQWDRQKGDASNKILQNVKKTLNEKLPDGSIPRITFATFIPVNYCHAGLCASYHAEDDTWALTKAMNKDHDPELGGHEMIITGYDDQAVATDSDGVKHVGLLLLRNSWGDDTGDNGNFYMTYDFFKKYVIEVQKIALKQDQSDF